MVIGNDTVLPCNEAKAIMVKFSGHVFHMICYLLECSKYYGLYIGQKAMYELEGGTDFRTKLIPIYHLTKKGVPFHWGELQQKAFEMIKKDLTEAPVLEMPNNEGHMVLISDTSKIACGSALYQEQKGRYTLIAYFSKKLLLSAQRYSISELELTGIYANVTAFKHLLRN